MFVSTRRVCVHKQTAVGLFVNNHTHKTKLMNACDTPATATTNRTRSSFKVIPTTYPRRASFPATHPCLQTVKNPGIKLKPNKQSMGAGHTRVAPGHPRQQMLAEDRGQ